LADLTARSSADLTASTAALEGESPTTFAARVPVRLI
jgi:hypothetical protein